MRNVFQILGPDLETPSKFVVCYQDLTNKYGGTRFGMNLARLYNIPIYNLFSLSESEILKKVRVACPEAFG